MYLLMSAGDFALLSLPSSQNNSANYHRHSQFELSKKFKEHEVFVWRANRKAVRF